MLEIVTIFVAANYAAIAMLAANLELPKSTEYRNYAESQVRYLLGENKRNSSYVVGIGTNPPQKPHHRARYVRIKDTD